MNGTATLEPKELRAEVDSPTRDASLRRFTIAVVIGATAVAVPYLWVLSDLWNRSPNLLRTVFPNHSLSDFYDLQARAMFHGHLYVPNGSLGAEAWVHNGRQYTYFGLFPSLLRMPILLITHSLDGRLTDISMLLAWVITGLFSSLLIWRVRLLIRGPAVLGRGEATTYGVLIATIMGGSVLVNLAASPWVFSEDIAWSVALATGSLFALLGVLEAPSWRRVIVLGALILAANLTRGSTGDGCDIGALLAAAWFASGHGGKDNRRWWLPLLLVAVVPLGVAFAVSWVKFGVLTGYPLHDQIAFNTHGLSKIKSPYFTVRYLPTTIATYLLSSGLHLSDVFPFITLPLQHARAVGNVPLYGTDNVTSVPGSMPLLLLLTLWGLVTIVRRRPAPRTRLTVIPLIAAAACGGVILVFGFLDNRFLGDFLPFLVLGSILGVVDIWRRLEGSRLRFRFVSLSLVVALGLFGIAANVAMASTPTGWWTDSQATRFVNFQKTVSDLTGHPLAGNVVRGARRPDSAPLDELFDADGCAGLYLSPAAGPYTWLTLEENPPYRHTLDITIHGSRVNLGEGVPLVTVGGHPAYVVSVEPAGTSQIRFVLRVANSRYAGTPVRVQPNRTYRFTVDSDLTADWLSVTTQNGQVVLGTYLFSKGPIAVNSQRLQSAGHPVPVTVVDVSQQASSSLCRSIVPKSWLKSGR